MIKPGFEYVGSYRLVPRPGASAASASPTDIYQHLGKQHLGRYVGKFDFRQDNRIISDLERAGVALTGIKGKRLTYRRTGDIFT